MAKELKSMFEKLRVEVPSLKLTYKDQVSRILMLINRELALEQAIGETVFNAIS